MSSAVIKMDIIAAIRSYIDKIIGDAALSGMKKSSTRNPLLSLINCLFTFFRNESSDFRPRNYANR